MNSTPRVSIGMPVRNGQKYVRQTIDSILGQSFTDFELIICDNDSTDDTEQICRDYAARDPRVRYVRNPTNIGPAGNLNRCVELARGEYFRWNNHDDMCTPEYLAKCVEVLERDPSVAIVCPSTLIIDDAGKPLPNEPFHPDTDVADPVKRFAELVLVNHRKHRALEMFGLMRTASPRKIPPAGAYTRTDSVVLARLALLGRFAKLPDRLFLWRMHASQGTVLLKRTRARFLRFLGTGPLPPPEWWDPSRAGKMNFPEWNLFKEYWISIAPSPLTMIQKLRCYGVMMIWLARNVPKLVRDVLFAIERGTTRKQAPAAAR
jgi:glycosyltransferase involved in cell wall biosynthesis